MLINRAAHYLKNIGGKFKYPTQLETYYVTGLEEKFCQNISSIYGHKFEYIQDFTNNEKCMTALFGGSKCNPLTGRFMPEGLPQSIREDCIHILALKETKGLGVASKAKFTGKCDNIFYDQLLHEVDDKVVDYSLQRKWDFNFIQDFYSKFKLKTNGTTFADTISHKPNEYLARAEQISQQTKTIVLPRQEKNVELGEMREFYLQQERKAAYAAKKAAVAEKKAAETAAKEAAKNERRIRKLNNAK